MLCASLDAANFLRARDVYVDRPVGTATQGSVINYARLSTRRAAINAPASETPSP
jgi:hypothetical protein